MCSGSSRCSSKPRRTGPRRSPTSSSTAWASDYIEGYAPALAKVDLAETAAVTADAFPRPPDLVIVLVGDAAKIREAAAKYGTGHRDEDFRSGLRAGRCDLMSDHGSSAKAILYAFVANLGIALAKLAASIYTNSGSMMAEAIHSFADCGNQVLLYLGLKQSQKPPDAKHPLGYGKDHLFLELHRRAAAVFHGRPVLDVRGLAQAACARGAQQGVGGAAGARCVDRARVRIADGLPARDQEAAQGQAAARTG